MKDCSLKICMMCSECKTISFNRNGFWHPFCGEVNFDELNKYHEKFSINKGGEYGPTEHCPFNFEHKVLDNRRNFKLKKFEAFKELYEYIQENKMSFVKLYGHCFGVKKDKSFYPLNNFWRFKEFILSTEAYVSGEIDQISFDEENMTFKIENKIIEESKISWLNRFKNKRNGQSIEESKEERKHRIVFPVAGVTFEKRQEVIKNLSEVFNSGKRFKIELEPEPNNEFDSNAIKVIVLNDNKREFIGYVPKTLNKDQENEHKIDNFNAMINSILDNIEKAETSWVGQKNGNYGVRVVCYEKTN